MNPLYFVGHSPSHNSTNFEIGCRNNFFCNILVKFEFFGWILLNSEFICVIGTVLSYLGNWGKRVNFSNGVAEIQQKYEREIEKVRERKFWISVITLLKFLLSKPVGWKLIVAMSLPK